MIVISREVYEAIINHARRGRPEEVCGVLSGTRGDPDRVDATHRAENAADRPRTRYAIDPAEQLSIMEEIEERGRAVVGFYHSHPDGPDALSRTDAERATWRGYPYVVVSLNGSHPFVGSWRWTGEAFEPEVLRIDGGD